MCVAPGPGITADLFLYPGLFMVMFSIISMDFFKLEAAQAGYLMSFFGILQMVSVHEQRGPGFSASVSGSGHPGFLLNHLGSPVLSDKVLVEKDTHRENTQLLALHPTTCQSGTCLSVGW